MSVPTWISWLSWLSLGVWLWLLLCHGRYWSTAVRLPTAVPGVCGAEGAGGAGREGGPWPSVSVVVPARDEAAVLPATLPSLLAQRYPGRAEIVLVDDGSSDGTADVARSLAAETPPGLPLTVCSPGPPPPGWTGKLWAVRHGTEVACAQGGPEYLLLSDADVAHPPDSLTGLVGAARGAGLDLVSQMARLRVATGWERLVVPAFVYFFALLYPFRRVNRHRARTAAAAGGCMLLRTEAAQRAGIPERVRGEVIDDVAVGRAVKRSGGRIWLGLADGVTSVRPYEGIAPLWAMVARSAYAQLRHSRVLLAVTLAGLALVFVVPPATAAAGALPGAAAWAVMTASYLPMVRYHRQPWWYALTLPAAGVLYALMTVDSARRHHRGYGAAWKGRTYAGR